MNGKKAKELRAKVKNVGSARNWNDYQMSTYYKILKHLFMLGKIT